MRHELQAYARGLARPLDDLLRANTLLREDIQRLMNAFSEDWDDQTFRRILVRACWSHIEAVVFGLKQMVLTACTLGSEELGAKTQAFLRESEISVDGWGNATVRIIRTDTLKNVKLSLKLASKYFDVPWKPNFRAKAWGQLAESLELRHRLTHPKSAAALFVSDSETEALRDGFLWFAVGFNDFLQSLQQRHVV
jgi:hypothetical protein